MNHKILFLLACIAFLNFSPLQSRADEIQKEVDGDMTEIAKCNGSETLCDKRYSEITFPGAHNAMSNAEEGWSFPNHNKTIEELLHFGIRVPNLDVYNKDGKIVLCHSYCEIGSRTLLDVLVSMKKIMEEYPDDVFTITFQDAVGGPGLAPIFEESGILEYAHAQELGQPWPTLREMIESGNRLVVFGSGSDDLTWFHRESDFMWGSPWYFEKIKDFTCGNPGDQEMYLMQHFILNPYPMEIYAKKANSKKQIVKRVLKCWQETGYKANIIIVDFATLGDLLPAVDMLNSFSSLEEAVRVLQLSK